MTTAPYHLSSNGLVERAVQTVKRGLKCTEGKTIQDKLSKFLFKYRVMLHTTTGVSPAELLINRGPRCCFNFLFPDVSGSVERSQRKQKENHDNSKTLRMFGQGDKIFAKNFRSSNPKRLSGEIMRSTGPLSYLINCLMVLKLAVMLTIFVRQNPYHLYLIMLINTRTNMWNLKYMTLYHTIRTHTSPWGTLNWKSF